MRLTNNNWRIALFVCNQSKSFQQSLFLGELCSGVQQQNTTAESVTFLLTKARNNRLEQILHWESHWIRKATTDAGKIMKISTKLQALNWCWNPHTYILQIALALAQRTNLHQNNRKAHHIAKIHQRWTYVIKTQQLQNYFFLSNQCISAFSLSQGIMQQIQQQDSIAASIIFLLADNKKKNKYFTGKTIW